MTGQARVVTLRSGGTVTLEVDADWLAMAHEDFEFIYGLTRLLEGGAA